MGGRNDSSLEKKGAEVEETKGLGREDRLRAEGSIKC